MKPRVILTCEGRYGDYSKGDSGVVDGYLRGGDDVPYAAVILDDGRFVMVEMHHLKFENWISL